MTIIKRLSCILLSLVLLICMIPGNVYATTDGTLTERSISVGGMTIVYTATGDAASEKIGTNGSNDVYLASFPYGTVLTTVTDVQGMGMYGTNAARANYVPGNATMGTLLSEENYLTDVQFTTPPSGSWYANNISSFAYPDGYSLPTANVTGYICQVRNDGAFKDWVVIQISTAEPSGGETPTERSISVGGMTIVYTATGDAASEKIGTNGSNDVYLASFPYGTVLTTVTDVQGMGMYGTNAARANYVPGNATMGTLLSEENYLTDVQFTTPPSGSWYANNISSFAYPDGYSLPTANVTGYICQVRNDGAFKDWVVIQISTDAGSNTGTVEKSSLEAEIIRVSGENAENFYQSDDRYNGKEISTNGFWSELTADDGPLSNAQAVYNNANATQEQVDAATEAMSTAISRLIPASQLNATELYEKIELVNSIFPPANASQYTASSWAEYRAGIDPAEAYLASLFDDNGDATEVNIAANQSIADGYAADVWALALNNVLDKKLSTLGVSANYRLSDAQMAYTALKNLCNVFFNPRDFAEADYTGDSWDAYSSAYETAQAFLSSHDSTTLTLESGVNEAQSYKDAYQAFWDACYGLTQNSATITVTLDVSDTFARINGIDHLAGGSYVRSLPAGTTLEDAAQAAGIDLNALSNWSTNPSVRLGVYVNGIYTQYGIGQESFPTAKRDGITLNDGDRILIARMDAPMAQSSAGGSSGAAGLSEVGSYIRYAAFRQGGTELNRLEATANTDITLEAATIAAEAYNALPTHYNGRVAPLEGAEIYRSKAYATEAEARSAAADIATGVITKSDGTFSLKLYSAEDSDSGEGWYLLNILASGENPGLTNAPNLLVHVTDPDDLSDVRTQLRAQLDEVYNTYSKDFYTESQLAQVQEYYEAGCTALADKTASSGELFAAYETAYEGIRAIQEQCEESLNTYLADIKTCLAWLPTQADLNEGRIYQADMIFLEALFGDEGIYSVRMSDYQKNQLVQSDINLIQDLQTIYTEVKAGTRVLEALPENRIAVQFLDAATGDTVDEAYFYQFNISLQYLADTLDWDGELLRVKYTSTASTSTIYLEDSNPWPGVHTIESETLYKSSFLGVIMAPGYALDHIEAPFDEHYMVTDGTWEGDAWYYFEPQSGIQGAMGNLGGAFITPRSDLEIKIFLKADSPLEKARQDALSSLKEAYDSYKRSDYSETNWNALSDAYQDGVDAINSAETEDAIADALSKAIADMSAVGKKDETSEAIPGWGVDSPFNAGIQIGTVNVKVVNETFPDGAFTGEILNRTGYPLGENDNMMTVILRALYEAGYTWEGTGGSARDSYDIGYLALIKKDGKEMGEFSGENTSGWMGTLNEFMVNEGMNMFTVSSGKLGSGDEIALQFTQDLGVDLGGNWGNSDTTLKSLEISEGTLIPAFTSGESGNTYDFALMISGDSAGIVVTPHASNINFMVKTFLNEKVTTDAVGNSYYRRSETITVHPGDVIYVGCGERAWPSMNKQGGEASGYTGTWYALHVINESDAADFVNELIAKLPAASRVNQDNYQNVQEQIALIDELIATMSDSEQAKVNTEKLEAVRKAVKGYEALSELKEMIADLPSDITQAEEDLRTIKEKYEDLVEAGLDGQLTAAEKAKVDSAILVLEGKETEAKLTNDKSLILDADWSVDMETANDAEALKTFVEGKLAELELSGTPAVTITAVTPAVEGTAQNENGTNGAYSFSVKLALNGKEDTAEITDAVITATAYVSPYVPPERTDYVPAMEAVLDFVADVTTNPVVGSTGGEWAVLALNRGSVAEDDWNNLYLSNLQDYVDECEGRLHEKKFTEYSRVVLALTSMGVDATQFATENGTYDLVSPLLEKQSNGEYWAPWQGNNGTAFALLALDSHNYLENEEGNAARAAFIESLKNKQLESGGWNINSGKADIDTTAAVIYALAPYYLDSSKLEALGGSVSYAELKAMVDDALAYLSSIQDDNGGFGSPEADGWVIIALSTLGIDADQDENFVKDGNSVLADLLRYQLEDGSFVHVLPGEDESGSGTNNSGEQANNGMSTEQAAYTLVAYDRFMKSKNALYDMTDVEFKDIDQDAIDEAKKEADQKAASEVEEKIDAIGEVTLESEADIKAARKAYDALTDEQKALVTNYEDLVAAEKKLEELKAAATQEEIDEAAASAVDKKIDAIGDTDAVTQDSEESFKAAREAYNNLTANQKKLVKNLAALEAAEKRLAALKKAAADGTITKAVDKNGKDIAYTLDDVDEKIILTKEKAAEVNDKIDSPDQVEILWQKDIVVPDGTAFPATLTFAVPKAYRDKDVFVYHYNGTDWEAVAEGKGSEISARFDSLSPGALVAKTNTTDTPTPSTGDNSNMFLWAGICVIAIAAAAVTVIAGKKRREE